MIVTLARMLLALLAIGQALDALSTNAVLASVPGAAEGNPLVLLAMSQLAGLWWLPKLGLAVLLLHFAWRLIAVRRRTAALIGAVAAAQCAIVAWNLHNLLL